MDVRFRLMTKRWSLSFSMSFRHALVLIFVVKIDINLIVQIIAPYIS